MRSRFLSSLIQTRKLFYEYLKPCTNYAVTYSQLKQVKQFSINNQKRSRDDKNEGDWSHNLIDSTGITHKPFKDQDAEIILDISERQETINLEELRTKEEQPYDPYEGINLERGKSGVFDIEELVSLLQRDNAKDIFVATVPLELSYVDYMVVVTGRSNKHMKALAAFIRKVYKLKRHKTDPSIKIEGQNSKDWVALDLGNIALHIFSHSARVLYDLESLWSIGPEFDDKSKATTEDIMEQYNAFLSDLEPIEHEDEDAAVNKKL